MEPLAIRTRWPHIDFHYGDPKIIQLPSVIAYSSWPFDSGV